MYTASGRTGSPAAKATTRTSTTDRSAATDPGARGGAAIGNGGGATSGKGRGATGKGSGATGQTRGAATDKGSGGFTLIEVLVVVVLIALTVTFVSVKLAPDDRRTLRDEAAKLAILLEQARDEAIGTGSSVAWQAQNGHYRFAHRLPDRTWRGYVEDPFREQTLSSPVQMTGVEVDGRAMRSGELLVFSPVGGNPPFRIHLAVADARVRIRSDSPSQVVVEDE